MATASPFEAAIRDVLDRLQAAINDMNGRDAMPELGQRAVDGALSVTRSTHGVVALGTVGDGFDSLVSRSADGLRSLDAASTAELLASAGFAEHRSADADRSSGFARLRETAIAAELRIDGRPAGVIAVARPAEYADAERQALAIFATHVANAIDMLQLKASVSRAEEQRRRTAETLRTAERVERAHELAVQVLLAVSSHARSGHSLNDFYRRLARSVADLVGARKVLFWRLDDHHMLAPAGGFAIDASFLARLSPTPCEPSGQDLASRVVFKDHIFRAAGTSEPVEYAEVLQRLGVSSAISVPWRAGDERLGLVAAYDSTRPGGFSREDTWVLQKAGLAAGLVTQLWHAETDLRRSIDRLTKVDSARQLLLKNMTTVVERERKRVVTELHDDALQKLTAVELQIGRMTAGEPLDAAALESVRALLEETENSLRRLVFNVRPPALETPDGLGQSIRDRAAMLSAEGISQDVSINVPDDLSLDLKSMLFRQVAEAVANVERHSRATHVKVSLEAEEGGVRGLVEDNGVGFDVAARTNLPGHLGLLALRERALMAGGWYKIESHPGAGTHVEFWIPLDQ